MAKKRLPVTKNPLITSWQWHATLFSILSEDDNAKKLASLRATTNDYAEICKKLSMLIESVDKFKKTDGNYSPRGYDLEDRPRLW